MNLDDLTVLILTADEEDNIGRTLEGVVWARRIVVIDSGSTDRTLEICARFPQVEVVGRRFDNHRDQWNFGLDQVRTEWVLTLDADYRVTPEFVAGLEAADPPADHAGYRVPLTYCVGGRPLRASLLPPRVALFRAGRGRYVQDGHTQELVVEGGVGDFPCAILHDDRKPFRRWLAAQHRYARLEVEKLKRTSWNELTPQDRLRKLILPAPLAVLIYCLLVRGLILEGRSGWIYTGQRVLAEGVLSWHLLIPDQKD